MKIAISGASGLIGSTAVAYFQKRGETVLRLVRHEPRNNQSEIRFDPHGGRVDAEALRGVDVVLHLAGENIAGGRWSAARKRRILESRVVGTRTLGEALASLDGGPRLLLSASATGYYGDCGEAAIGEDEPAGEGFLADVCRRWEAETQPAEQAGVRVVNFRLGVVLAPQGGALTKMLPFFRLGLGGRVGSGRQYLPWVALDDVMRALAHMIRTESIRGPVNLTSPEPATNAEFTKALGRALHRPTIFPVPAFAIKLLFGQMGVETLLSSCRAVPNKLAESGFAFNQPSLPEALNAVLSA